MNTSHPADMSRRNFLIATAAGAAAAASASRAAEPMLDVRQEIFGQLPDGQSVSVFTLTNGKGIEARVMTLGATLLTVRAPDRAGKLDHITLYLDTLADYLRGHPLFGSVVGRYANRIADARFTIDGTEYKLVANARPHHIHGGGKEAFHNVLWKAEPVRSADSVGVKLTYTSRDGDAGFPGNVDAAITYTLGADNRLTLEYTATTDKPTHVNLTNHAYWNLAGAGSGDVLGHILTLNADAYLPADRAKIPTGEIKPVKSTPMDFTQPQTVGSRIDNVEDKNYDHCYVLNKKPGERLSLCACVVEPKTGRTVEVRTTQPGVQLYTARGLSDRMKAGGKALGPYHGLCLETQHYPDSPNKPQFPSTLLRPGQTYRETTIFQFGVAQ